jgi:hypothetical protein
MAVGGIDSVTVRISVGTGDTVKVGFDGKVASSKFEEQPANMSSVINTR